MSSVTLEKDTIIQALEDAGGNVGQAARALGASRRTLQNRMRTYELPRGKSGRPKRPLPYGRRRPRLASVLGGAALVVVGAFALSRYAART